MKLRLLALLPGLLVLASVASCFSSNYVCSTCKSGETCPDGLMCRADGYCVPANSKQMCSDTGTGPEIDTGSTDVGDAAGSAEDAVSDLPDASSADDTPAVVDAGEDGGGDDGTVNRGEAGDAEGSTSDALGFLECRDRCCVGSHCFDFPLMLQRGLLLWADRPTLGKVGLASPTWLDRSGGGRNLVTTSPEAPPFVQSDGVGPVLDVHHPDTVIVTGGPTFQFGTDDFTVLMLARCDRSAAPRQLFESFTPISPRTGVRLTCNNPNPLPDAATTQARVRLVVYDDVHSPDETPVIMSAHDFAAGEMHLFGIRRKGTTIQLRVDGHSDVELTVDAALDLRNRGTSAIASHPGITDTFSGQVGAVVIVKGALNDTDVTDLEDFLIRYQGENADPL